MAVDDKSYGGSSFDPQADPAGTIICGASHSVSDVAGGKPQAEGGAIQPQMSAGKRNPFALVVVALVAAAMLYFGFHMARRSAPPAITKSGPAPDFTLQSLDGTSMRLSDFRGKAVLLNFWATWCGPCLTEMPDLVTTWRMFRRRDFDLVTVATNYPDEKAGVLKMLQQQHASGRNLQFASQDTYAMQAAFDAKWDAGVPFTMVIAPGGKVLYQQQGEVDILALRRLILANMENETYVGHPAYWAPKSN